MMENIHIADGTASKLLLVGVLASIVLASAAGWRAGVSIRDDPGGRG